MTRPNITYTARDYDTILAELQAFAQAASPEHWTDFSESNLGVTLMQLVAFEGDILAYGQDTALQEVYLSTARRYESALRAARSIGYRPRSSVSARVNVASATLPQNVFLYGASIPAGTQINGTNGMRYEVPETVILPAGTSVLALQLVEGTTHTETFVPTRAARQEFTTARGIVEEGSWSIYVGDVTNPTNRWTEVTNVALEATTTKTFETFFDGAGKLHVRFGDGQAGQIPGDVVTLTYRVSNGSAGNAPVNAIFGSIQVGVTTLGVTASVAVRNSAEAATGGLDRETVDDLRQSIPAFIKTLDRVSTLTDYETALRTLQGVGLVFAETPLSSYQGNVIRVNVWDAEVADFTATSPENGIVSTVSYRRYAPSAASRAVAVQRYLRPRTYATVHNIILRPTVSQVDIDLGRITYDRTLYAAIDVHESIVRAVTTLFEQSSGFALRVADLYEAVSSVPGVQHFVVRSLRWEHNDWSDPNTTVVDEFRTDQDADGVAGGPYSPLTDLIVPATNGRRYYDDSFLYDNEVLYDGAIESPNVQCLNLRTLTFNLKT